jgi:hypothetical protein
MDAKAAKCLGLVLGLALSAGACRSGAPATGGAAGTGGGAGMDGAAPALDGAAGGSDGPIQAGPDAGPPGGSGRVTLHRLTRFEYDNTVKDLLYVASTPADTFQGDDLVDGFDNLAEGLHISPARYLQYLDAAKTLAETVFADDALRGRIVTCAEDAAGQCARDIIKNFGLRAWRRPLSAAESESVGAFYDAVRVETGDFRAALQRTVAMMLSSLPFLYKVEVDPEPTSTTPHPLSGYELASRLSYLLWGSMPDDELLRLAPSLGEPTVLMAQVERLLADAGGFDRFVRGFAGRWLGVEELAAHHADRVAYPRWDGAVSAAMVTEMYLYFREYRTNPLSTFFTNDVHWVDGRLAANYNVTDLALDAPLTRIEKPATHAGFLGLAGFLTLTSPPNRTSPSMRGRWILEHLLCAPPDGHPPGIMPKLNLGPADDVRKALTLSLLQPSCRDCHATFDGLGFALEHFDGIGIFRQAYASPMEPIDATGSLGAATFDGAAQLGAALSKDPRFAACTVRKALSYALGRRLTDGDADLVAGVTAAWKQGSINALLREIVATQAFRFRHGEAP